MRIDPANYFHLGPLLLTWINNHIPSGVWNEITYPCINFNGCTVEDLEEISSATPHVAMDVIAYTCRE